MIQMNLRLLIKGLFVFWMLSCGNRTENQSDLQSFDLVGLVDSQVIFLTNNQYQVNKSSGLGPSEERTQFVPDSAGWARELNIIRTVDISKPGLRSYYALKTYDSLEFRIEHYFLMDSGNSDIIFQKIYRDKYTNQLLRVQILQNVTNPIYYSNRFIELIIKKEDEENLKNMDILMDEDNQEEWNNPIIDSIIVEGFQKMILSDTTFYRSISKILR